MGGIYHLGLGSNLGDRWKNLKEVKEHLKEGGVELLDISGIYETKPMDCEGGDFLNQVLKVKYEGGFMGLWFLVTRIETGIEGVFGRERGGLIAKARRMDIDLLLYGQRVIDDGVLKIPHSRMFGRRFVLEPLYEMEPDLELPLGYLSLREYLDRVRGQEVRRLGRMRKESIDFQGD